MTAHLPLSLEAEDFLGSPSSSATGLSARVCMCARGARGTPPCPSPTYWHLSPPTPAPPRDVPQPAAIMRTRPARLLCGRCCCCGASAATCHSLPAAQGERSLQAGDAQAARVGDRRAR